MQVTEELRPELLGPLLCDLAREPCGHSWQPALVGAADRFAAFRALLRAERPSRYFTVFDEEHGAIAIGAVSDRVCPDVPCDGFPVIGRAFVRPAYRGRSVYSALLTHRVRFLQARFEDRLRGLHLGTASEAVEHCFRERFPDRVVHVGNEDLGPAGRVRALLALSSGFMGTLCRELDCDAPGLRARLENGPPLPGHSPLESVRELQAFLGSLRLVESPIPETAHAP